MNLDTRRIREERVKRAWTQEQLAEIADMGLRTLQRIEATGVASIESAASLSSALSIPVSELRLERAVGRLGGTNDLHSRGATFYRVWCLLAALCVALILSPPKPMILVAMWVSLWIAFELGIAVASRSRPS